MDERHQEVRPLANGFRQHAAETIEHHRALAAVHCELVQNGVVGVRQGSFGEYREKRIAGNALGSTRRGRGSPDEAAESPSRPDSEITVFHASREGGEGHAPSYMDALSAEPAKPRPTAARARLVSAFAAA